MQTKACDVCRKRKIKCVLPESSDKPSTTAEQGDRPATSGGDGSSAASRSGSVDGIRDNGQCVGCTTLGLKCTWTHIKRRPGRPNSFAPQSTQNGSRLYPDASGPSSSRLTSPPGRSGFSLGPIRGIGGSSMSPRRYSIDLKDFDGGGSSGHWGMGVNGVQPSNGGMLDSMIPNGSFSHDGGRATSVSGPGSGQDSSGLSYARGSMDNLGYPIASSSAAYHHQPPDSAERQTAQGSSAMSHAQVAGSSSNPLVSHHHLDYNGSSYSLALNDHSPSFSSPSATLGGGAAGGHTLLGNAGGTSSWAARSAELAGSGVAGPTGGNVASHSLHSLLNNPIPPIVSPSSVHHHPPQIEDITSFTNIFFFISLYLRHLHSHTPVVHKPTFTQQLAMRVDQRDEEFRALLLSLTSYVISQSPKSRMIEHYSQDELERLQGRCHMASQMLQTRRYKKPSLVHLGTLMADYFFCTSTGKTAKASAILGEAAALSYRMGIHDETRMAAAGYDHIQLQLSRRAFWHLYAIDKTEASGGMPSYMHDFEGVPAYPQEVDDDFITSQGMFPQPASRPSTMIGFVAVTKLFRIMSECLFRHRIIKNRPFPGLGDYSTDMEWIAEANERIAGVFDELPPVLSSVDGKEGGAGLDPDLLAVFGMQRANLLITAASVKFALYDLKEDLSEDPSTVTAEQEAVSREMYKLLSTIPLDALAACGESMRGKLLRIIISLLNHASTPDHEASIKDWWGLFTTIQFVQMVSMDTLPSRAVTPTAG